MGQVHGDSAASRRQSSTTMLALVLILGAVASAQKDDFGFGGGAPRRPPPPPADKPKPLWFVPSGPATKENCNAEGEAVLAGNKKVFESPTSEIFVPEGAGTDICIFFAPPQPQEWQLGKGLSYNSKSCSEGCCFYTPASSKRVQEIEADVEKNLPTWFRTPAGGCDDVSPWMSDTIANKKIDTENNYKEMHLSMETDSSERADSMSVEANLEVNVLSGLVQVSAGGKYMTSAKETSNSVRVVLKYEATNYFTMMPYSQTPVDQSNLDFCSNDNLAKEGGPTHVVSSVQFGTTAFVLFEREVFRGESEEEVSGYLSVNVANAVAGYGVNSSLNFNYTGSLNTTRDTINIHFLGNSLIDVPQSLEDISSILDDLDETTRTNPQPLRFTLARIDEICSAADVVFASIGNPTLERLADILRSFADSELRTKTFLHEENSVARRQSLRQALEGPGSFGGELNSFQGDFKMELSKLLVDVRSNATNDVALESIILDVDESYFEEYKARTFLDYFERQINYFDTFYDTPEAPHIQVDNADGSLQSACILGGAKNTYIFTLNVLPHNNLATEFFAGTLDTNKDWISDEVE